MELVRRWLASFLRNYNIMLSFDELDLKTLEDFFALVTSWLPDGDEPYVFFLHLDEVRSRLEFVYASSVGSSESFPHVSLPSGTYSLGEPL